MCCKFCGEKGSIDYGEFGTVKCTKITDKALNDHICVSDFKNDIGFDDLASPKVQRLTKHLCSLT